MAEGVASKETPKNMKIKKQRWLTNLKCRANISADSKRLLKTERWKKSLLFLGNRDKRQGTVQTGIKAF